MITVFMHQAHSSTSFLTFIRLMSSFKSSPSNLRKHIEVAKLRFPTPKSIFIIISVLIGKIDIFVGIIMFLLKCYKSPKSSV